MSPRPEGAASDAFPRMLTPDEMIAEVYRKVCVSSHGRPCLIDLVDRHERWIETHESKPTESVVSKLGFVFLASMVGGLGASTVGIVGWGIVTVLRRALVVP